MLDWRRNPRAQCEWEFILLKNNQALEAGGFCCFDLVRGINSGPESTTLTNNNQMSGLALVPCSLRRRLLR
jgi:hypothetical protein